MTTDYTPVGDYDVMADRMAARTALAGSPKIDALTSRLDVYDMNSITTFGADAAGEIARVSDDVLRDTAKARTEDIDGLMEALAGLMARLSGDDGEAPRPGLLGRLLGGRREAPEDARVARFEAMGGELDGLYSRMKGCAEQLRRSNRQLQRLFEAEADSFHSLEAYIVAGEQGCREIEDYLKKREAEASREDDEAAFERITLRQALEALRRRTQDLRLAEAVALQSLPMIKALQADNLLLANRIDAAFAATLPAFRRLLSESVESKRQALRDRALGALEARDADALADARRAVAEGIEGIRDVADAAGERRRADAERLAGAKRDYERGAKQGGAAHGR